MEEEIKAEFERRRFSFKDDQGEEILRKCLSFCINHKLSASDLVSSWEVYYLNRQLNGSTVQNDDVDGFLLYLQNEQKDIIIKEEPNLYIYSSNDVDMILDSNNEDAQGNSFDTPMKEYELHGSEQLSSTPGSNGRHSSSRNISNHLTPFGQRTNKFVLQFPFNNLETNKEVRVQEDDSTEDDVIRRVPQGKRCSLQVHQSLPEPGCRFMYDRIEDKYNFLEGRIQSYAAALVESGQYGEPTDATLASQKSVFVVGMVCCDGEGHLNEKSILLQGSVEHSGGQRVRLDLQALKRFSLFPGQVIGIEGHNPSGHCLIASRVVDSVPFSVNSNTDLPPAKKPAVDDEYQPTAGELSLVIGCLFPKCNGIIMVMLAFYATDTLAWRSIRYTIHRLKPVALKDFLYLGSLHNWLQFLAGLHFMLEKKVIAAGPYTTTDNLLFEPFVELLSYARRKQPQLLVLLGPFLDSEHSDIKKGTVNRSLEEIFRTEVLSRLQDYVEYMGSSNRVILMPATRDAHHDFVFPQPAFDFHLPDELRNHITGLANPGVFSANEVVVSCCTEDILKQLSSEEISRIPADGSSGDRMGRLATHILNQRSFYPLHPPSLGLPLDLSLAPEALHITSLPNILILPSDLAPFIKVLFLGGEGEASESPRCICVNPGRLAKGIGGGTFVELNYVQDPKRTNASIIRI